MLLHVKTSNWRLYCHCVGDSSAEQTSSSSSSAVCDQKCSASKTRMKNWHQQCSLTAGSFNQSLSRGISFELEAASSSALMVDDPGTSAGRRRGSLLQGTSSRRGSALHGQLSATESSSSSSSSSERRRSSCLSDVSVRSGSSKRSSTGDFSSELEEYFDNVAHRSLQTAVIEEEAMPELTSVHDSNVCGRPNHLQATSAVTAARRVSRMTGQNLLEHFVDNLINEAAQQSKTEVEQYLVQSSVAEESVCGDGHSSLVEPAASECLPQLEHYATHLANDIVTRALEEATVNERQGKRYDDGIRPARHATFHRQATEQPRQHGRRFERQQTVSGFRDALLSDFDQKLINSNLAADAPLVTFANTAGQKRRSSEPAYLNYSKNSHSHRAVSPPSSTSSVDCRKVISSWFTSRRTPVEHSVPDTLSQYAENLVLDAFVESVSSSKSVHRRHRCRTSSSQKTVPDAISLYADHLTSCILQAVQHQLRTSGVFSVTAAQTSLQSVAETFARSIVDDALAVQSMPASSSRLLVSCMKMWTASSLRLRKTLNLYVCYPLRA